MGTGTGTAVEATIDEGLRCGVNKNVCPNPNISIEAQWGGMGIIWYTWCIWCMALTLDWETTRG